MVRLNTIPGRNISDNNIRVFISEGIMASNVNIGYFG